MILQALYDYYHRSDDLPREGWLRRNVDYELTLNKQGECIAFHAIGSQKNGETTPAIRLVTSIGKQSLKHNNSGTDANLLWDNASFVLGYGGNEKNKLSAFIEVLENWFPGLDDDGVRAVHRRTRAWITPLTNQILRKILWNRMRAN